MNHKKKSEKKFSAHHGRRNGKKQIKETTSTAPDSNYQALFEAAGKLLTERPEGEITKELSTAFLLHLLDKADITAESLEHSHIEEFLELSARLQVSDKQKNWGRRLFSFLLPKSYSKKRKLYKKGPLLLPSGTQKAANEYQDHSLLELEGLTIPMPIQKPVPWQELMLWRKKSRLDLAIEEDLNEERAYKLIAPFLDDCDHATPSSVEIWQNRLRPIIHKVHEELSTMEEKSQITKALQNKIKNTPPQKPG